MAKKPTQLKSSPVHRSWLIGALRTLNNKVEDNPQFSLKALIEDAKEFEEQRIVHLASLKDVIGTVYFYPTHAIALNLMELFVPDEFENSAIYDEFYNGLGLLPDVTGELINRYVMTLHLSQHETFVVYQARGAYEGFGGIRIKGNSWKSAFIIEPLEHWFRSRV